MTITAHQATDEALTEVARGIAQRRGDIATAVRDMAHLLSVSQANVATVRDQPWYKRIWATITRSNSRLAEQNAANLLEVQRLAMGLLTILPQMDELAARSIACLQYQVRILTFSDLTTKTQLEELTKRCALRFADHERRILNIEGDTRLLKWIHSRYDPIDRARYDDMPVAKRVVVMSFRFMELTEFAWDEAAVHSLLNTIEASGVRLDDKWSLRALGTRLYEEWLAFVAPEEVSSLPFAGERAADGGAIAPVRGVVREMQAYRATGYAREHMVAALDRLAAGGLDLDEEVPIRDLVRTLLDEERFEAFAGSTVGAVVPAPRRSRAKGQKKEYWHRRTEPNRLLPETLERAKALLSRSALDRSALLDVLSLYDDAFREIDGKNLDLDLLQRLADISLSLPTGELPADRLVGHAKRLFQYGKTQTAYEWHAHLVESSPEHAELRNNLGFILLYRGKTGEAQRELERATALGFRGGVHWINRGIAETGLGNLMEAERHLRQALDESSGTVAAEIVLLCGQKDGPDASSAKLVLTAGSMKAVALCNLGLVLHGRRSDGAARCFEEAIHEERKLSFAVRAAGWFYHVQEQHRRASDHFKRARELEPRHPMNEWEHELLPAYYFFRGGRNDPCPCTSGRKFKDCCARLLE